MRVWTSPGTMPAPALGFVTFHPDPGFYDRVALACSNGFQVFVFDNAPAATDHSFMNQQERRNLHYMTAGNNLGLGVGLSALCASAYARGCEYLLFFDQDTRFTMETLDYAKTFLQRQVAQVKESHAAVVLQAPSGNADDHRPIDTLLAISSGMLFLLHNVARIGWHNPKYFVDGVDYEFCLRARSRNFRIAICSGAPGFDHVTDQADTTRTVFGRQMRLRKYRFSRVADSLWAYVRLTITSLGRGDLRGTYAVVRSMGIFIVGQCLAWILLRGSN